jgi:hypothetical protein
MGSFSWSAVKGVMAEAASAETDERRVLLVLTDASYHVKEVLSGPTAENEQGLLGFVVYRDDPELSQRTEDTTLLFVRPEEVRRVLVAGYDSNVNQGLGF